MDLFLRFSHIGMFALRSSISVQVIKKIFGIINKPTPKISISNGVGKKLKT